MKRASVNMGTFAVVGMLILLPIGAFAQEAPAETAKSSEGIVHTPFPRPKGVMFHSYR